MVIDNSLRILLITDDPADRLTITRALRLEFPDPRIEEVAGAERLSQALATSEFGLVIVDAQIRWTSSLAAVETIKTRFPDCPLIMFTNTGDELIASKAVKVGLDGFAIRSTEHFAFLLAIVQLAMARARERQAAKEVERRYRALFDGVPVGLYRTTPTGQIMDANRTFAHILGYPDHETLLSINATDLYVDPGDRQRWQARMKREGSVRNFEVQFYRGDGVVIWVENSGFVIRDLGGQVLYYEGILTEITERKRVEEVLQESEERFRTMVEQSPIGVLIMDSTGRAKHVNRAWHELWKLTAKEQGKPILEEWNILKEEQFKKVGAMPYIERAFAGEALSIPPYEYDSGQTYGRWHDDGQGRKRIVQYRIYPVKGEKGEARNVIAMAEDVTDRERAKAELLRRTAHLEAINAIATAAGQSLALTEVLDATLRETLAVLDGDGGWISLLDETRQEFVPATHSGFSEKTLQEVSKAGFHEELPKQIVHTGEPYSVPDLTDKTRNMQHVLIKEGWQSLVAVPLTAKGRTVGVMVVCSHTRANFAPDISGLLGAIGNEVGVAIENARLMDTVTKHSEELRRLSAQVVRVQETERKRISRELHDELGQALTAMRINLATIERDLPSDAFQTIRERLIETRSLVDQTLEQVRELSLNLRPTMLDDLGLVPTLRWYVNRYSKRVKVEVDFIVIDLEERLSGEVEINLYRIIQEALTNVAKHAKASKVYLCLQRKGATVAVAVRDDGQGFDMHRDQGARLSERRMGLLGLGERVTHLGGIFDIDAGPGRGTRLSIEIPLGVQPHEA